MEVLLRCLLRHDDNQPHDFVMTKPPKKCPKCGNTANHSLIPLVRVFLLVKHPDGPIHGAYGRYYCAGDPTKKDIQEHLEAFTSEYSAVNNPACMRTKEYQRLKEEHELQEFYRTGGLVVPSSFLEEREEDKPAPVPELVSPPADTAPPAPAPLPGPTPAEELPVNAAQ